MYQFRRVRRSSPAVSLAVLTLGITMTVTVPAAPAAAAPLQVTASGTYNAQDGSRFPASPTLTGADAGKYRLQANLWNKAVAGSYTLNADDSGTAWSLTNNTANSYFTGAGTDTEPSVPDPLAPGGTYTCVPGTVGQPGVDPFDPGCHWAGHGDPWINHNPAVNAVDPTATTGPMPSFVPQHQAAPVANHVVGLANEFSNQIHAPASYADIYLGCHWGQCSPGTTPAIAVGAPFPLRLTGVSRLDSVWNINVPASGVYDASYDIWLDSNTRNCPVSGQSCASPPNPAPVLPANPQSLSNPGQNDGAEVMIWVGHRGYVVAPANSVPVPGTITPAGRQLNLDGQGRVVPVSIPGITSTTFDVWAGRSRSFDNGIRWNVITFVARSPISNGGLVSSPALPTGGFDSKPFIDYAAGIGNRCSTDPTSPIAGETVNCLDPAWWLTSVQAGYEIWNLPASSTMATTAFSVRPVAVSGGANTGNRACPAGGCAPSAPAGTPLVNWMDTFAIQAQGCPNDADATWSMAATNFINGGAGQPNFRYPATPPPTNGPGLGRLQESPAGSGNYVSVPAAGPLNDPAKGYVLHDVATITITIHCNGQAKTTTASVFIDPSGRILAPDGTTPIPGATVSLLRSTSNTAAGPFVLAPVLAPPNNLMQPNVSTQTSNQFGFYRWDVVPGFYKVSAAKAGCTAVNESGVQQVSAALPPITALDLILDCGGSLAAQVHVTRTWNSDSGGGYCADLVVTNRSAAPMTWRAIFGVDGTIYTAWNLEYVMGSGTATGTGLDWNKTLAPGASTSDVGFCANH
jgi:hypothetical protein